jgi:creatinine amidohydrolase
VLPYVAFSFPGGTTVGRGTVYVSPSDGLAYLKIIARSLLRQGFRRQIYVSVGHGPTPYTVSTLVREFFEETKDPILYIEMGAHVKAAKADMNKVLFGSYSILNRLEDIPLNVTAEAMAHPSDQSLSKLNRLGPASGSVGFYYGDALDHGEMPAKITSAQRSAWAKEGVEQIEAVVKGLNMKEVEQGLARP